MKYLTYKQKMDLVQEWKEDIRMEADSYIEQNYLKYNKQLGIKAILEKLTIDYYVSLSKLDNNTTTELASLNAKDIMDMYKNVLICMHMCSILDLNRVEAGLPPNLYPGPDEPFCKNYKLLDNMRIDLGEIINTMTCENSKDMVNILFDLFPDQTAFAKRTTK